MRRLFLAQFALLASLVTAPGSWAAVIYSNFGAGDTYIQNIAYVLNTVAMEFTAPGNYNLTQIDLGVTNSTAPNTAVVALYESTNGLLGALLGSWGVSDLPANNSTNNTLTMISGITGITLTSGDPYFLQVSSGGNGATQRWNFSPVVEAMGAFRLLGDEIAAVPEPASLALLGIGLAGLAGVRRRLGG